MNKILTFDNLSRYNDKIQTVIDEKVKQLITDTEIKFFCIEPVTIVVNGIPQTYPGNTLVDKFITSTDTLEIITTSNSSIKALYAWPGALGTYYD